MRLSDLVIHRHFKAGTEVVHQDETNELFAFVLSGVLKLTRTLTDGRQQIVGSLSVSDCLGDPFNPISHDSVECVTDVTLCCFPRTQFRNFLSDCPELEHQLLLRATRDIDDARQWILSLGQKNAREKIATFLLWFLEKQQHGASHHSAPVNDTATLIMPFTRREIGEFLGMTLETASRQFSRLRAAGTIKIHGTQQIEITDLEALRALAEEQT